MKQVERNQNVQIKKLPKRFLQKNGLTQRRSMRKIVKFEVLDARSILIYRPSFRRVVREIQL